MIDIPGAELPNPINAGVPTKPPAIVVKDTGKPDANGIIAEAPAAPVDPVGPVDPVAPVAPVIPVGPVSYTHLSIHNSRLIKITTNYFVEIQFH